MIRANTRRIRELIALHRGRERELAARAHLDVVDLRLVAEGTVFTRDVRQRVAAALGVDETTLWSVE